MDVLFRISNGLNATTRDAWTKARDDLGAKAQQRLGDQNVLVATSFVVSTEGKEKVFSLECFNINADGLEGINLEGMPEAVDVETTNAYGETFMKSVPVFVQERQT